MDFENIIQRLTKERGDISSYMFCLFVPYIGNMNLGSDIIIEEERVPVDKEFWVSREEVHDGFMNSLIQQYLNSGDQALGLTSLVRLEEGRKEHLGLVDFHCDKSRESLEEVERTLISLNMRKGFIIDSGNSYHFISIDSRPWPSYVALLEKMCDYSIIGDNWPRLQIPQGYAVLRATACPKRGKHQEPELITYVEDTQLELKF